MTSKLTRERLQEIAEDGFLKHGESKELARMALAAMDSEPVILYRQVNPVNGMKTYWAELDPEEFSHLKQHTDENAEFMTLYRHAQQVPEEVKGSDELYDVIDDDGDVVLSAISFNEAQTESDGYNGENLHIVRHEAQPAPAVPEGLIKAVEFYEQVKRENPPVETGAWKDAVDWVLTEACRAAMLSGGKS